MKRSTFLVVYLLLTGIATFAQGTIIEGPTCVLSGVEYQYNIKGDLPAGAQLCVNGGKITESSSSNCISDLSTGFVRITWSGSKGSIAFTSSQGNYSVNVAVTTPLQPGAITNGKEQNLSFNATPSSISCTKPVGGGCGASYQYQWQQSLDNLNWQDIPGASAQSLSNLPSLTQTVFYRRKTTETISRTIVYSDAAVVYVAADTKAH
jgi:hypothetical protein